MEKCNKMSKCKVRTLGATKSATKIATKMQQKLHNNYVALLIKRFVFIKLVESL